ncbi:MAG: SUMF1/EgtB/PvdO family nonheme iron enzyme [Chloroflexota bacterium]
MAKIFISYRRKSVAFTLLLANKLSQQIDADIFVDFETIDESDFETSIMKHLRESDVFLLMVTEHTFADRIHMDSDWVRKEIRTALEHEVPIVLVSENGLFPPSNLPDDIREIRNKQGIEFYPAYFDAAVARLVRFLVKATNVRLKPESPAPAPDESQQLPVPKDHIEDIVVEQEEVTNANGHKILADALSAYDAKDYAQALFLFEALQDIDYQTRGIDINETMAKARELHEREKRKQRLLWEIPTPKPAKEDEKLRSNNASDVPTPNLYRAEIERPTQERAWWKKPEFLIGAVLIPIIAAIIGGLIQNPEFFGLGDDDATEVVQVPTNTPSPEGEGQEASVTFLNEEEIRETAAAGAFATLTANAPTDTPTITPTPSNTPLAQSEVQQTVQAEIFATATSTQLTAEAIADQTQRVEQTQVFAAGLTATNSFNLSQTPPATNTQEPPTSTPDTRNPEQVAFEGVTSNTDWKKLDLVREDGYVLEFDGVEMVLVPAGCFIIGSDDGDSDEVNGNEVCVDAFWIDKYEVSNEQYGSTGCERWSSEPEQPRNCISWINAQAHCVTRGGSLPTEAQWEYAARGPDGLTYPWGDNFVENNALYAAFETAPVGSYPDGSSWVGALNMSGNVWEWTLSEYVDYPYNANDGRNDNLESRDVLRVRRGGSFDLSDNSLRSTNRDLDNPLTGSNDYGFRCVLAHNQ